jgi:beta-glucosidase
MSVRPTTIAPTRRALMGGIGLLTASLMVSVPGARAQDARVRHAARIDELIARMTIVEKAGQLSLFGDPFRFRPQEINPVDKDGDPARIAQLIRSGGVGALFNGVGAAGGRTIQDIAVRETRLGIPLLFAADVIHGLFTVFPVPLGEAASWDAGLAERTARAAARESAASGIHQTYAPMVDVGRDQRWGRVVEGAGEDVFLGSVLAAARVRGFQGPDLTRPDALLATPKHFAAYGAAEAGLDYNTVDMSEQRLRGVYLPPFKAGFDAGALSTMSAFNEVNGVPATGSEWLLTDILRGEWGFDGYVVSDYTSEEELIAHGFAEDGRDAARIALLAGVDMSMVSGLYNRHIPDLVASGDVPMAVVDRAVRRVLGVKAALGLFDDPWKGCDPVVEAREVNAPEHHALAREAARKSMVLLKNDGSLLPLPKTGQRIAVIGPFGADTEVFGPWTIWGDKTRAVSLEVGLRATLGPDARLTFEKGADPEAAIDGGVARAVAAARRADVVILAIGEAQNMSAEAQSRSEIVVPPPQQALAEAVRAVGKPTVVLLRTGRALAMSGAVKAADAILVTWFLGSQHGHAIADVLFGDHAPSGRLPVSFPHVPGQQPFHYDHKPTGRPADPAPPREEYRAQFREAPHSAAYPFGHGLSYAPVTYGPTKVSAAQMAWDGPLEVSVEVTNGGDRAVEETVQLYVRDRVARLTRPVRELKGFRKVVLAPGQTRTVVLGLDRTSLNYMGPENVWTVEPGEFDVWLAPDAQAGVAARFRLVR